MPVTTKIQFKRGKRADLPQSAPSGTPLWCEDSEELYIGTGNSVAPAFPNKSRNIGELVVSTIPLYDAGLHLLDGSLISGSGIYSDFVSYMKNVYESTLKIEKEVKYYAWSFISGAIPSGKETIYTKSLDSSEILQLYDGSGNVLTGWVINTISNATMTVTANGYSIISTYNYSESNNITEDIKIPAPCFAQKSSYNNSTLVGDLADINYVISGFTSTTAYIQMPVKTPTTSFELVVKTHTPATFANYSPIETDVKLKGLIWRIASGGATSIYLSSNGTANNVCNAFKPGLTIPANMDVWLKVKWDGATYSFGYSTDGTNYTEGTTVASALAINWDAGTQGLGGGAWESYPFTNGAVDLKGTYLNIDGQRYWDGVVHLNEEETWQRNIALYGKCAKFVYNPTANTVRLPKMSGFIEGTTDIESLSEYTEAGIPNITGNFTAESQQSGGSTGGTVPNAFYGSKVKSGVHSGDGGAYNNRIYLDASRVDSIYGNSHTVQPESLKQLLYIVIANSKKTSIEVDINKYASDVNNKADIDLSNCSVPHITESYKIDGYWKLVYSNGFCRQGGILNANTDSYQTSQQFYLPQPYVNTEYNFGFQSVRSAGANIYAPVIYSKAKDHLFYHNLVANGAGATWYAEGFIR